MSPTEMTPLEKLELAKELIARVEIDLIETKGVCPYELGYTLKNLEDSINFVKKNFPNKGAE